MMSQMKDSDDERVYWVRKVAVVVLFASVCLFVEVVTTALVIYGTCQINAEETVEYRDELFRWHPILFSIGTCVVLSQSLTVYFYMPGVPKAWTRLLHGIIGLTWLALAISGLAVVVEAKIEVGDDHFMGYVVHLYSIFVTDRVRAHERIGLVVVILSAMQAFVGMSKAFFQYAFNCHFMSWHGKLGIIIYVLALVAVGTGVNGYFEETQEQPDVATAVYVLLAVMGFLVLLFDSIVKGGNLIPHENEGTGHVDTDDEDDPAAAETGSFPMTDTPRGLQVAWQSL